MHKLTVQYCDPADPAAFEKHYREVHVPLAAMIPGLRRFTVSKPHGLSATAPYLVAELWFDDSAALDAGLRSPEGAAASADMQNLTVGYVAMFTGEVEEVLAG
ncbi:MAG TPA: EthD family reductase [Trebonia sp.]|nr:EthD family reductase [Trebonia sp.]